MIGRNRYGMAEMAWNLLFSPKGRPIADGRHVGRANQVDVGAT